MGFLFNLYSVGSARVFAIIVFIAGFAFNEWAFRFIFPLEPVDSFLRLLTLVLDAFLLVLIMGFLASRLSVGKRARDLLRLRPKAVAIYFGFFISFCVLVAVEFGCRFYFKNIYVAPYSEATYWEPSAVIPDSELGSSLARDTTITHAYVINDSLIYKQAYRTDGYGRRITPPSNPDSSYTEFMAVTGCSFAFGYGLPENQTLSYYLDSLTGKRAYNYAVAGYGTQQTLALLQSRNIQNEVSEENGVMIHLFIDDHLPRLIGSRRLIKLWAQKFPYYYLDGDSLIRDGNFWTGRHFLTRFYRAISQSAFIDLFDIDFPWYVSNDQMKLWGAVMLESEKAFLKLYPDGKFLVVIGPNSKLAARSIEELRNRGVGFLDLSQLLDKENKHYKIHWTEAHPNQRYYLEIAQEIEAHLSESEH